MKASDLFVKSLENEGVEYIFGIPGEENLDFLDSLRGSKIKLILTRHEQGAGFMAATLGRLTGKVGVCISTLGPGATNLVTPAAYAQLGAMPMMMITGQKPVKKSKQGKFQVVDIVEMMQPITKYTKQLIIGDSIPVIVRGAIRIATAERPGAVHLELPEDVAAEECTAEPFKVRIVNRAHPDDIAVNKAVEMIKGAKMPLLLIGAAANRNRTCRALPPFLEKTGIYFIDTQMGKGVVDERHPRFLGTAALSDNDYLHCAISRADLIINVGHDVVEKPPFFMEHGGTRVIHINYFPSNIDDVYFPQLDIVGDIGHTIEDLTAKLEVSPHWDFSYYELVKKQVDENLAMMSDDDRYPILPEYLVAIVRKVMPSNGIIALDNGVYKIWFARNYKAHGPNTVLLDNALATMGAGLPSAMAASLIYPDKKIIAICGDGGFMMNSQELETAVRLGLNLVVIVLRDNAYGMIKWKQMAGGFPDFGLDYGNPDFVKYAESYGAEGHRVNSSHELFRFLEIHLAIPGVQIIEVPIDYTENQRVLIDGLNAKTCALR